jgi:hypothetical protein
MVLSALINAVPLSYDNMLLGFNTHFYLLLAFSFASLWLMADSPAWSPRWAAGGLFGLASFLWMASGALTFAASAGRTSPRWPPGGAGASGSSSGSPRSPARPRCL